jgi:hypothetical protein
MDKKKDGENVDYNGFEFGRVTPFSCYCRIISGKSPDKLSEDEKADFIDSWSRLEVKFKNYYRDVATKMCGGNWIEEDFNEYTQKKKNYRTKRLQWNYADNQMTNKTNDGNLEDLMKKVEEILTLTQRSSPFDMK